MMNKTLKITSVIGIFAFASFYIIQPPELQKDHDITNHYDTSLKPVKRQTAISLTTATTSTPDSATVVTPAPEPITTNIASPTAERPHVTNTSASEEAQTTPSPTLFTLDIQQPTLKSLINESNIVEQKIVAPHPAEKIHVTLVNTDLKYPYVRVETTYRESQNAQDNTAENQVAMIADHMLVKKSTRLDADEFTSMIQSRGLTIRHKVPGKDSHLFLVGDIEASIDSIEKLTVILQEAQNDHYIEFFEPDYLAYSSSVSPNDNMWNSLWGLKKIGMPEAWDIEKGDHSVVVGVIDTGIDYQHSDLQGNIWVNSSEIAGDGIDNDGNGYVDDIYGYNFVRNDNNVTDADGHGTHVAGTIAAKTDNNIGVSGINWNASLMAIRIFDDNGVAFTSDIAAAIQYATDNGAAVTNNSWGGGGFSLAILNAIQAAGEEDVLFVAAAGNDNRDNDSWAFYPASYAEDNVISVAASHWNDQKASFSNYGKFSVDLVAPGVNIWSTADGSYRNKSGTSMAAPHVTGTVALLKAFDPTLSATKIKQYILDHSTPLNQFTNSTVSGGRLDVGNTLAAVQQDLSNPLPEEPPQIDTNITLTDTGFKVGGNTRYEYIKSIVVENNLMTATPGFRYFGAYPESWVVYLWDNNKGTWHNIGQSAGASRYAQEIDLTIPDNYHVAGNTQSKIRVIMKYRYMPWGPNNLRSWGEARDYNVTLTQTQDMSHLPPHPSTHILSLTANDQGTHLCGGTYHKHIKSVNLDGINQQITLTPGFRKRAFKEAWGVYALDKSSNTWLQLATSTRAEKYRQILTLTVPDAFYNDVNVNTTLRVIMKYNTPPSSQHCNSIGWGQAKEYTLTLKEK